MTNVVVVLGNEGAALASLLTISMYPTLIRMVFAHRTRASLCWTGPAVTVLQRTASSTGTVNIIVSRFSRQDEVEKRVVID